MSWPFILLLALAFVVLVGAEWQRVGSRVGLGRPRSSPPRAGKLRIGRPHIAKLGAEGRKARERQRLKESMRLIPSESDDFAASVERDLAELPTIDEKDRRR